MGRGGCVVRYDGKRGVVWRIKYCDASRFATQMRAGTGGDRARRCADGNLAP
jgi:hypothetical protein